MTCSREATPTTSSSPAGYSFPYILLSSNISNLNISDDQDQYIDLKNQHNWKHFQMIKINKFKKQTDRLLVVSEKKLYKVDAAKIKVINDQSSDHHQTRHRHEKDEECDDEYDDHHPR